MAQKNLDLRPLERGLFGGVGTTAQSLRSANPHSANDFEVAHRPVWYPFIDNICAMRNVAICAGAIVTICVGWSLFSEFSDSREKLRLQASKIDFSDLLKTSEL